jgi:hypothetical protein
MITESARGRARTRGAAAFAASALSTAALVVLLALTPGSVRAQDATLDRIHNLIAAGRFTEASNTLEQWERSHSDPRSSATPADRARALFLRGTLSDDPKDAEEAFVGVVLSYPSSFVAPEALLRLGQSLVTTGEARRAVAYLERLRTDYPGSPHRETGWLWLARAQFAAGSANDACATARTGLDATTSPNLRVLIELERDRACAPGAQSAAARASQQATRAAAPTEAAATQSSRAAAPAGEFAVQTGAYRERSSAQNIADQMRARGFDVRVVLVGDSPLHRVRFGAFPTSADAAAAARTIQAAGFATIIVSDVREERR